MLPGTASETDYRVLGLKADAKPAEVKRAYRSLAKKWHPDRYHSKSYESRATAEEKFREINEAYVRISSEWANPGEPASAGRPRRSENTAEGRPDRSGEERPGARTPARPGHLVRNAFAAILFLAVLFIARTLYFNTGGEFEAPQPWTVEEKSAVNTAPPLSNPQPPPLNDNLFSPAVPAPPPDLLPGPAPGPSKSYFTIGSTNSEVRRIQGDPSRVQGETWIYGVCEVRFRNGRVWRYNNFDGSLMVRMEPGRVPEGAAPKYITIGSTEDEVLLVQGTPTRVEQDRWYYGFAEIKFKEGRVSEYDNYFGALRVRVAPSENDTGARKRFFTVGSTRDEVLDVQGTPTGIAGNVWSYDFSYVFFRDGKVRQVSDAAGKLRFVAPADRVDVPAR